MLSSVRRDWCAHAMRPVIVPSAPGFHGRRRVRIASNRRDFRRRTPARHQKKGRRRRLPLILRQLRPRALRRLDAAQIPFLARRSLK